MQEAFSCSMLRSLTSKSRSISPPLNLQVARASRSFAPSCDICTTLIQSAALPTSNKYPVVSSPLFKNHSCYP